MYAVMNRVEVITMMHVPEIDFAKIIMMLHKGAISMVNMELKAGKNDASKQ